MPRAWHASICSRCSTQWLPASLWSYFDGSLSSAVRASVGVRPGRGLRGARIDDLGLQLARRFVDDVCPPERAKEWDETHHYPQELFDGFEVEVVGTDRNVDRRLAAHALQHFLRANARDHIAGFRFAGAGIRGGALELSLNVYNPNELAGPPSLQPSLLPKPGQLMMPGPVDPRTNREIKSDPAWLAASPVLLREIGVNGRPHRL